MKCKPVTKNNWSDFEKFFESKGCPHYCWCMAWRNMKQGTNRDSEDDRKASMKAYVTKQLAVGLLAYKGKEAIAWCSVAPRDTYRDLGGDESLPDVWSIVCFFIKRDYRKQGLMEDLIDEAMRYAKKNGAKYIEAYPVDADSPSYRFMGFRPVFEKKGFRFSHKAGSRRNVMAKKIG